jgi:hypothetical protein
MKIYKFIVTIIILALACSCSTSEPNEAAIQTAIIQTQQAQSTSEALEVTLEEPTNTPTVTNTPEPTNTRLPTITPKPTNTPEPTANLSIPGIRKTALLQLIVDGFKIPCNQETGTFGDKFYICEDSSLNPDLFKSFSFRIMDSDEDEGIEEFWFSFKPYRTTSSHDFGKELLEIYAGLPYTDADVEANRLWVASLISTIGPDSTESVYEEAIRDGLNWVVVADSTRYDLVIYP